MLLYPFSFFDNRLNTMKLKNISLNFSINNDENYYQFSVNCDGIKQYSSEEVKNNLNVYQNFDNMKMKSSVGEIFVGIEFRNKTDKSLNNVFNVSAYYGRNNVAKLIENVELEMYVPTTPKQTASKVSTTKTTTTRQSTTKETSVKITTKFSTSQTKDKTTESTKFTPSKFTAQKTTSKANSSTATKYSAEKNMTESTAFSADTLKESEAGTVSIDQTTIKSAEAQGSSARSKPAVALLCTAGGMTFVGLILILSSIFGKYKIVKIDEEE